MAYAPAAVASSPPPAALCSAGPALTSLRGPRATSQHDSATQSTRESTTGPCGEQGAAPGAGGSGEPPEAAGRGAGGRSGRSGFLRRQRHRRAKAQRAAQGEAGGRPEASGGEWAALAAALERGGGARAAAVRSLRGSVLRLSFEQQGCRAVQTALQWAPRDEAVGIASELRGHVRRAMGSPHANYVVQKVVQALPAALSVFVATELAGAGVEAARHRFGCRIVCRLIEHTALSAETSALLEEILAEADKLSRHTFGHHVVQSILEHGQPQQRAMVVESLRGDLLRCSLNRNSSHVVDKALTYCGPPDRDAMAAELLACPDNLLQLAKCQFGFHVVRAITMVPSRHAKMVLDTIECEAALIRESRYGQRLLEDLRLDVA